MCSLPIAHAQGSVEISIGARLELRDALQKFIKDPKPPKLSQLRAARKGNALVICGRVSGYYKAAGKFQANMPYLASIHDKGSIIVLMVALYDEDASMVADICSKNGVKLP